MFPGFGTLVNASLILLGSFVGLRASRYIPTSLKDGAINAIGLFTLMLGVKLIYENKPETLKVFFTILIGSALGHLAKIEESLHELLKNRGGDSLSGFVSASVLFTVGPMTLLGCILEGTKGDSTLILSKAFMDGFSSIILSSSLGKSVAFSAFFVLIFQGSLTMLAFYLGSFLPKDSMSNALFVGGGLMLLTGAKILGLLERIKVLNFFPSLFISLLV
ncbi:putative membrane protein YdfK [bacterium HR13]|nr:putative membrane protein YdfK [bacterium HR13]